MPEVLPLLMDRTYEGDETRQLVLSLSVIRSSRLSPTASSRGSNDCTLYKKRNQIEGLFLRLKGFRRISLPSRNSTS
jgi:hypothetical protein